MLDALDPVSLVPHRAPSLIVREIVERGEASIVCRGLVGSDHPCVRLGQVPALLAIEFAAQTAAVLFGLEGMERGQERIPTKGYLVSLRETGLNCNFLPVERDLTAEVVVEGRFGPMALCSCRVVLDGKEVAAGRFGVTV